MANSHIHTWQDGRGPRRVFLNDRLIPKVVYADTKKGVIRFIRQPLKIHKYGKRVVYKTLRGNVKIEFAM